MQTLVDCRSIRILGSKRDVLDRLKSLIGNYGRDVTLADLLLLLQQ